MATYFFCNGGVDNNWGTVGNWGITTGTPGGGAVVPLATDDAIFDANSPNCNVNSSSRVCKTLNFTGTGAGAYANTITMNQQITVSGSVTLSATMTIAGAATLVINVAGTHTSNGKTWPNAITFTGVGIIHTWADSWVIGGTATWSGTTSTTMNGSSAGLTFTVNGSITASSAVIHTFNANLKLVAGGTGTVSTAGAGVFVTNGGFQINATGTITFPAATTTIRGGTITYTTAASIVTTGNTLAVAATTSFNTSGMSWNNITLSNTSQTYTLLSNLNLTGTLSLSGTTTQILNGAFNINVSGGVNVTTASLVVSGTATIVMTGTGTLQTSGAGSELRNNLTINTAGTITLGTTINYNTGTFTFTAGTINPGSNTWSVDAATTLNFNATGFTFNNVTLTANTIFQGTNGFTVSGLFKTVVTTAAYTHRFKEANTYTFNGGFTISGTATFSVTLRSVTPAMQAILTIAAGSTIFCTVVVANDIDSSLGQQVVDYFGTLSNATNWKVINSTPVPMMISTESTQLYIP